MGCGTLEALALDSGAMTSPYVSGTVVYYGHPQQGGADQVMLLKLQTCELSKPFCFLKLSFLRYFIKAAQNGLIHGYRKYSG